MHIDHDPLYPNTFHEEVLLSPNGLEERHERIEDQLFFLVWGKLHICLAINYKVVESISILTYNKINDFLENTQVG